MTRLRYPKGYQFFDNNGLPLSIGSVQYFQAGTSAPLDTYADSGGTVANPNPVVLDASGRLDTSVYLGSSSDYREVLLDVDGNIVAPWPDDYIPRASSGSSGGNTDLSVIPSALSVTLSSSTGSGAVISRATAMLAGVMSATDKAKLDGIAPGAQPQPSSAQIVTAVNTALGGTSWQAGSYDQLTNKPVLGTAASLDVAASGDASTTQVVKGDDTRLSNARAPQSHAASHAAGGFDPVTISATQVTGIAASLSGQNVDRVARLGVNTADTTNPLSVNGATALFSNSGDIRVTLSKGAESDTASLVLQDNFSGRAEIGLTGDDDLTIKTSPDGTTFNNAIVVGAASGAVSFPNTGGFIGDSGAGGASGLVPAPPAGAAAAGKFLKADGTWAVPPGSGVSGLTATVTQFPDHIDVSLDPSIASASVVPASDKISITLE